MSEAPDRKDAPPDEVKEIETRSTSLRTAECNPIILRQLDHVRLVFAPTIVKNDAAPEACVKGQFIYQKKKKNDHWVSLADVPLGALKCGEGYKLELHSSELLTLLRGLSPLYQIFRQQGIAMGRAKFVRLGVGLARFLALGEADLTAFLEAHRDEAATTLLKLVRWLGSSPHGNEAASRLAVMAPEQLPGLNALLGLAAVKNALSYWEKCQAISDEEFWQQALTDRAYVISQVFAYPIVVIRSKAYVGGKQISNTGGNIVDFLASVESTDAVVLIEIKTPQTRLLASQYREGVFPLSGDLTGAVAQVLRYRQSFMRDFDRISREGSRSFTLGEPRCLVIAGNAANELSSNAMRESFELQRERLQGVTIIGYDELFRRLEGMIALLEGSNS